MPVWPEEAGYLEATGTCSLSCLRPGPLPCDLRPRCPYLLSGSLLWFLFTGEQACGVCRLRAEAALGELWINYQPKRPGFSTPILTPGREPGISLMVI